MNKAAVCTVSTELQGFNQAQSGQTCLKQKKKSVNLYGSLGAKYSDLLDMHEANCNMVILLFCVKPNSNSRKPVEAWW